MLVLRVCVRTPSSSCSCHNMTNSIAEIPEDRMQLPEWWVTLHLCVGQYVQVWGNSCTHCLLTQHWLNLRVLAEGHRQANKGDKLHISSLQLMQSLAP